jgi:hypothetical protein
MPISSITILDSSLNTSPVYYTDKLSKECLFLRQSTLNRSVLNLELLLRFVKFNFVRLLRGGTFLIDFCIYSISLLTVVHLYQSIDKPFSN